MTLYLWIDLPLSSDKMIQSENKFSASGNTQIYYQCWLPEEPPKATIVIVHGGGDHSGRFGNVVNFLVPKGFGIYMFDLRGHGKSPGKRGHIKSWDIFRNDLSLFLELTHENHPEIPLFLLGHSMGGVIVLDYTLRFQKYITAVICSSPAIGEIGISPFLIKLARILNGVWPSLVLPTGLIVPHLSRDNEFIRATLADPYYHSKSTPRFGMEMIETVEYIRKNASSYSLPLYLIHGTGDKIASIEGSRKFVNNLKYSKATYKEYKDGYHELFNDTNKEVVLIDLVNWLERITGQF